MKRKLKLGVSEEIVRTQNSIREKLKRLRLEDDARTKYLKKSLKPITEPLNTIIRSNAAAVNMTKLNDKEKVDSETNTEAYMDDEYLETENNEEETPEKETNQEKEGTAMDPVLETFFKLHHDRDSHGNLDKRYGIRSDGRRWMLGDSPIGVEGDKIIIQGKKFQGSLGLYELLFLKKPDENFYDAHDLATYKAMLLMTNAHKQVFDPSKNVSSNRGEKYNNIIKGLLKNKKTTGTGINSNNIVKPVVDLNSVRYEYWDDPNELVDRLGLLVASKQAGNTSVNNEILSIIEELREARIIE